MARTSTARRRSARVDFDPWAIASAESDAWVTYYRHEWAALLVASVRLVGHGFRMTAPRTLLGAWYVMRANLAWAPYPDNDPAAAVELMRRFFRLVINPDTPARNAATAAQREVDWWRAHREHQHRPDAAGELAAGEPPTTSTELVDALARSFAYLYGVDADSVRPAARLRAEAMDVSDRWVAAGCRRDDPMLLQERRLLLDCYAALRDAVSARP